MASAPGGRRPAARSGSLRDALAGGEIVARTGVILQELLQGVVPERAQAQIIKSFAVLE